MFILGMESSCDETSCAVVYADEQGHLSVLSNIVASQIETHKLYGGVVPEIASRAHIEAVSNITYQALEEAKITLKQVDCIAVTTHPGLIGALLVGVNFAKSLAFANHIPLVSVHHIKGHIAASYLCHKDLKPPFLALAVSGGHTSFYDVKDACAYEEIGSTRDDAIGEAFDKIARVMGMPYPGGAALDKLAFEGDKKAILFPSPAIPGDNLDFSFSGIKTAALNYLHTMEQKGEPVNYADVAASYIDKIVSAVVKKAEMAIDKTGSKTLAVAGGVAANKHLREALENLCKRKKITLCMPDTKLCGDNAAMIASQGYFEYLNNNFETTSLNASACD